MKQLFFTFFLIALIGGILLTGCAQITASPVQPGDSKPVESQTSVDASTPTAETAPTLEASPTLEATAIPTDIPAAAPSPTQVPAPVKVAQGDGINHQLIFAIRNAGRYSGEGGQPAWLGWGADNLSVAPDGSLWIADTPADPDRLLHYSPQGELLGTISMRLGDQRYWARDLFVYDSGVWVLDYISQPGFVLHLSPDGSLLSSYAIPEPYAAFTQEGNLMPGLWHIVYAEASIVILDGPVGIVAMTTTDGAADFKKVSGYEISRHVYSEVENGLMVDDLRVGMKLLQPDHFLNSTWLLGVASDGSFYVREDEGNNDQGKSEPPDRFVRRYSTSGDLLGIALLPLPELDASYDVALGPDGNVYAMFSQTDHSVEVLRLGFSTDTAPLLSPYTRMPQPAFKPLLPSGATPATDLDAAREAMLTFYADLSDWRFDDAAALYGGSYAEYQARDESISPDQPGMAWQNICQMEFCLKVADILDSRQVAPDEYEFLIGFVTDNGVRFDYSICCGNFQPTPAVEWFVYTVNVKKINGQWLVMGGPLPLP